MTDDDDLKPLSLGDPLIDHWLSTTLSAKEFALIGPAPLVAMPIVVGRTGERALTEPVPDEVINAWVHMQENYRRQADQSEASLVALILRQGGSWDQVARVFGVQNARAAQERHDELMTRLNTRPHIPDPN